MGMILSTKSFFLREKKTRNNFIRQFGKKENNTQILFSINFSFFFFHVNHSIRCSSFKLNTRHQLTLWVNFPKNFMRENLHRSFLTQEPGTAGGLLKKNSFYVQLSLGVLIVLK